MTELEPALTDVAHHLRSSRRVVVLTGAGMSTDSGIADYRGPQGRWTLNPDEARLATLQHYLADPEVRRRSWQARLRYPWDAQPNAGHHALVQLERLGRLDTLITQNIDGLHQRAGTSPERVIEIHGTVHEVVCWTCTARGPMSDALSRVRAGDPDPACLQCGGILKSATIAFGQALVDADLHRAEIAASSCEVLLALGSTLSVYPIADVLPLAHRNGARIVIINGTPTEMDSLARPFIRAALGECLPRLIELMSD